MLNVQQISIAAFEVSRGERSLYQFERWFREASRNVHAWGDTDLKSAVLLIECVLSDYHFDGLEEGSVGGELEAAIRPFVRPQVNGDSMQIVIGLPPFTATSTSSPLRAMAVA